ncbi:hypothetical protein N566_20195 [Streptomycetaceae bacterium MP113-05]|nr:hypothetical protein N566_20195 [Streptomycetaceae bacterium MP113-05]
MTATTDTATAAETSPSDDADTSPSTVAEAGTSRAWVAPAIATAVSVPLTYICFIVIAIASMACPDCLDEQAARFHDSLDIAFSAYQWGLLVPLAMLGASWVLLGAGRRHAGLRLPLAAMAPFVIVLLCLGCLASLDTPS